MASQYSDSYIVLLSIDGMANYYLADPQVKMPHLRSLIKKGVAAGEMASVFPTATWAIHTSLTTGKNPGSHGVLGNWAVNRDEKKLVEHFGDRAMSADESISGDTLFDIAKQKGMTTASICWPVTKESQSIDFNIPEFYDQELFEEHCTNNFWEELKEAGFPVECYGEWSTDHARGHMQDSLTTDIASYLIKHHKPNFMALHYLLADSYQHDYGTRSKEVYWALEYIDEQIGKLINSLKAEGIYEKTTLFIVSDHGFVDTTKTFYPNVLFKKKGWYSLGSFEESKVVAVSNGGSGYVYIFEEDPAEYEKLYHQVIAELNQLAEVNRVFTIDEFHKIGIDVENHPNRPDFAFEVDLDCFVHFSHEEESIIESRTKFIGMHGYHPEHEELKALFIAAGQHVHNSIELQTINVIDVAPTICQLLDGKLYGAEGRVHDLFLKKQQV